MAKELPYFKFFVSEWSDGDITLEDYETQGLFINICSYYWSNRCNVSVTKLKKKFKGFDNHIQILIDADIIKVKNESVIINFLDEQMDERIEKSNKNSEAARKRWDRKKNVKHELCERNANASKMQCKSDAIKIREDKKRKEENVLTDEETFEIFWNHFHKTTGKPKEKKDPAFKHWKKLKIDERRKAYNSVEKFSKSKSDSKYLVIARTYLADKVFNDEFIEAKPEIPKKETYEQIVARTQGNKRYTF